MIRIRKEKADPKRIAELEAKLGISERDEVVITDASQTHATLATIYDESETIRQLEETYGIKPEFGTSMPRRSSLVGRRRQEKTYRVGSVIR